MEKIVIIDYGAGNVFSVQEAVGRLGYKARISGDREEILEAERIIFPGVGQAAAAMEQLKAKGLDKVLPALKIPVLGICLGMQLMCTYTEEGDTQGLGIFNTVVKKMRGKERIPHIGWNTVYDLCPPLFNGIQEEERMYFVHSYYVPAGAYCMALCDYPFPFAAAIGKANFYGCQFHPEKSGGAGERVLKNFLTLV